MYAHKKRGAVDLKYNWEFIFQCANIDAVKEAEHLGIRSSRAANCSSTIFIR